MDEKWICFSNRMDEGTLSKGSMIRFDGHWDYNCTYVKCKIDYKMIHQRIKYPKSLLLQ